MVRAFTLIISMLAASTLLPAQIPMSFDNKTNCTMTIEFGGCNGTYTVPPVPPNSTYPLILDPGDSPDAVKADFPGGSFIEIEATAEGDCNIETVSITPHSCFTDSPGIVRFDNIPPPYPPVQYSFIVW